MGFLGDIVGGAADILGLGDSGQGAPATSTSVNTPWASQIPYLEEIFKQAQKKYKATGPSYYPNSTIAPFSTETNRALQMQADRALAGSPITAAGQQQLTDTLSGNFLTSNPAFPYMQSNASGDYLNGNPYIDQAVNRALGKVRGTLDSQFEASGRYGSGLHKTALANAYGDTAANMYGTNYANERQNQLNATSQMGNMYDTERQRQIQGMLFAPQMANQDYYDAAMLAEAGGARDAMAQGLLDDKISRWNYNQNLPNQKLNTYLQMIQGDYGGTKNITGMDQGPSDMEQLGQFGNLAMSAYKAAPVIGKAATSLFNLF